MTFTQLELSYQLYKADHTHAHQLFTDCVAYAKSITPTDNLNRDEIAADAGWTAWSRLSTLSDTTLFAPWFVRVVRNKQRDYHRKQITRTRVEAEGAHYPARSLDTEATQRYREEATSHRPLVDLLLTGSTLDEAADALQVTVRTLRRKLHATAKEQTKNV